MINRRFITMCLLVTTLISQPAGAWALTGRIVIAGYGPEQPMMQDLAHAYEREHPGTAIDFEWEKTVRAVKMVKEGEAQIAVADQTDAGLTAVTVAWDGIAVIVNFSNPLTELTSEHVRAIFSGGVARWSEIDGADQRIDVITRTSKDNVTAGFDATLGLAGKMVVGTSSKSDQQTLRLVSGRNAAISYMSLGVALKAQEDGIPIRVVTIDHVEPGEPTVANGLYPLRRPILLLTTAQREPLTESFLAFVQSPEGRPFIRTMYTPLEKALPSPVPSETKRSQGTNSAS